MARMIPSVLSEEEALKSKAEARIFGWFNNMQWGDAIVLHSLPLKDHIKKSFGEIDFVVICEKGVICIEVKGGGIERKDGQWGFTGKHGTSWKNEGPYWQVQGNMKSLRKYLSDKLPNDDPINKCRFACCVMTPDCVIKTDNDTEVIPEISFNSNNNENDLPKILERSFDYWEKEKHYGGSEGLNKKSRERLAEFLRGDFCFLPPLSVLIDRSEEQLLSTTAEQLTVIENMTVNDRMMVEGGAGTGKTLLATEQCRRAYITGEKVMYLCFNNMIASFIKEVIKSDPCCSDIEVFTFHELLMKACGINIVPEGDAENFFNTDLPELFLDHYSTAVGKYDRIIIDEGQDLMNTSSYLCINEFIEGGWEKGKWTVYYDPNQNIFGTNKEFQETWRALKNNAFIFPLTVNCRNTKQIAEGNYAVTHIHKTKYTRADGEEIAYKTYKNKKDEAAKVFDSIRRLRSEGLSKKDIVILSYYRMDNPNSCLYNVSIPADIGDIKFNQTKDFSSSKSIRYYTVKSFKGMDSKAVIMIDVDSFSDEEKRLQNYVGMSRARAYLEFFYDETLKQERQQRLVESLLK